MFSLKTIFSTFKQLKNYFLIGLLVATALSMTGWYITNLKLDSERAGRKADKTLYEKEQKEFEVKSLKNKIEVEKIYAEKAEQADASYNDLINKYTSVLLLRSPTTKSENGPTNLPRQASPPEDTERAGEGSFLSVGQGDLLICAENTAKAQIAHDWIISLDKK